MDSVGEEKRRFFRVEEAVCAWLQFRKDGAAYGTLTVDLGIEGARFSTPKGVAVGDMLLISLQLPKCSIECKGKICWSRVDENGMLSFGVRFLDLRETEREHLTHYVNQSIMAQVVTP